jgi:NAD(P)-dependent dehydrogenase (short-subunit alcohol dehydrogenase family)
VTAAGSGLGAAAALKLAENGVDVARSKHSAQETFGTPLQVGKVKLAD